MNTVLDAHISQNTVGYLGILLYHIIIRIIIMIIIK